MTGPEHYRKAETLVEAADDRFADGDEEGGVVLSQIAQVHATLALAAATAMAGRGEADVNGDWHPAGMCAQDFEVWDRAAGA